MTSPARLERVRVRVTAVNADGTVQARDTFGKERRIRHDIRAKGTAPPAVGELWEAVQRGSTWLMDRMIGHPPPPVVTGSRAATAATLGNLLSALESLGLIDDQTTA